MSVKNINQHLLSIDDIVQNEKAYPFYGLGIAVQENGFCRIEQKYIFTVNGGYISLLCAIQKGLIGCMQ